MTLGIRPKNLYSSYIPLVILLWVVQVPRFKKLDLSPTVFSIRTRTEAMQICVNEGVRPYVFQSQNVDGFDNDAIYKKYDGRVKSF